METKKKLLKTIGLDKLGKIVSQSLNKSKQSLNKTITLPENILYNNTFFIESLL